MPHYMRLIEGNQHSTKQTNQHFQLDCSVLSALLCTTRSLVSCDASRARPADSKPRITLVPLPHEVMSGRLPCEVKIDANTERRLQLGLHALCSKCQVRRALGAFSGAGGAGGAGGGPTVPLLLYSIFPWRSPMWNVFLSFSSNCYWLST